MEEWIISVPPSESSRRLDTYLSTKIHTLTRSQIKRLIEEGKVLVNGRPVKPSLPVRGGEEIRVFIPPPREISLKPEPIPLDILYEDEYLIVVNKPAGMVVHPGAGVYSGTLVNALLYHCKDLSGVGGYLRPGIVHRLDKETSGIMVVAKDDMTHVALSRQFKERKVKKVYLALVWGDMGRGEGVIDLPIGRHPSQRKKMSVRTKKPRHAITRYTVKERLGPFTLLEVRPETGRTHQIRVHLSATGHPVVGDKVYGRGRVSTLAPHLRKALRSLKGHCLHAFRIGFYHPGLGKPVEFEAPLPDDILSFIELLRGEGCTGR